MAEWENLTPVITGHSQEMPAEEGPRGNGSASLQPDLIGKMLFLAKGTRCGSSPCLRVIVYWDQADNGENTSRRNSDPEKELVQATKQTWGIQPKARAAIPSSAQVPQHPQGYQEKRLVHKEDSSGV